MSAPRVRVRVKVKVRVRVRVRVGVRIRVQVGVGSPCGTTSQNSESTFVGFTSRFPSCVA